MADAIDYEQDVPATGAESPADPFQALYLDLKVQDAETVAALSALPEGPARDEFALSALRIGVLALRQARGQLDANVVQRECERMLQMLHVRLHDHSSQIQDQLAVRLREYFDPETGRFHERVQRLVSRDGELEQVLRRQIGTTDSELCKTLAAHFGQQSPLMKMLSPNESEGLLAALRDTLARQLEAQREAVLRQFSLDNKDGALTRMIGQLTDNQGRLTDKLQGKIDEVVKEFSLNNEEGALTCLVRNVERAQKAITDEFSLNNDLSALSRLKKMLETTNDAIHDNLTLDEETSALSRLKRELLTILETHSKSNLEFQQEVKVALNVLVAKREEAARSTRHGNVFEDAVFGFLQLLSQQAGDTIDATGNETGLISNCKVGDCVIRLGADSVAAGAQIVVEAKEKEKYDLHKALAEIEKGRQNRASQVGLFVFSKLSAPAGLEPIARHGGDVVVIWDAEDSHTDLYLKTGLTLAKALCIRAARQTEAQAADFSAIDAAILEIAKRAETLGEITSWTETIRNNGDKILNRVRLAREGLERQVETLQQRISDLKQPAARRSAAG